ncbi:MAG: HNH endonuclease [Victivallaceae bacterium]|nr:HNH endonuclease [Victivallaceae bacterium]
MDKLNASKVLMQIAEATWKCGDPGLQFDDTINYWHTCKNSGRINASNPCCFTGDTLVKTSEGDMTFDELMSTSDLPYAFAWDFKTNMPVLRKIKKVWCSGDSERLVKVTTDRGITVECTPEHRFYLRDGSSVEAQDLKSGMRLRKMPISQNAHRGGRRVIRHKSIPGNKRGEQWLSRFIWTQVNGEISDGVEIHHRNHDRTDDRLSNLGTIHDSDHRSHHSSGLNNGRAFHVDDFVMVEAYDEVASTENATHKGKEGSVNASRWNRYVRDNGLVGVLPIANSRGIQGKSWDEFHKWIEDRKCLVNDRVKDVQHIEKRMPVYDMEVEDVHNFTVTSPGNLHGIVVSNSEYMFLDDSACNLASLNLIKYLDERDNFKVLDFARDIRTLIRSMDALVDGCSYPTAQIAENSHRFRPLGLGYCNLGGLLMALGVPYDSDEGRAIASEITSYMTAIAYHESANIAKKIGAFEGFENNRNPMLEVVSAHWKHSKELASGGRLIDGMTIDDAWSNAYADGRIHGYRNAQVTVLAPTGTISLFMDAETGGIEPFLGLISYKKLVGGGTLTKASQLVERGLKRLGYDGEHLDKILEYIKNNNNVLTDLVKHEHQKVFETSFGAQSLPWKAHIDMMAAVQPFLSGAISKTVNMPNDAIADDIYNAYHYAWRSGLKSIAIYRDGSKAAQPESSKKDDHVVDTNKKIESDHIPDAEKMVEPQPVTAEMLEKMKMDFDSVDLQVFDTLRELVSTSGRVRLPQTRNSLTHKFDIAGHEGYFTVGLYDNGQPGELFITISKEGSTIAGLLGVIGTLFSMAIQSGVPLNRICDKFIYSKFEPSGWTANEDIGYAHSIVDYIFRWLKMRFVDASETEEVPMPNKETVKIAIKNSEIVTGEPCKNCGGSTVPSGACWVCTQCGETTGCG